MGLGEIFSSRAPNSLYKFVLCVSILPYIKVYLDMHVFLASSKIMVYLAGMAFGYLLLSTPYKDTDSSQD